MFETRDAREAVRLEGYAKARRKLTKFQKPCSAMEA